MINLFKKYRSIILYVIFGGFTTIINFIIYLLCTRLIYLDTLPSNILAWLFAVLFAYLTNRKWVFESNINSKKGIVKEIVTFYSCRLFSGLLDISIMFIFVSIIGFNDLIIKVIDNIIVIILNYICSKLLVFKSK